MTPERPAAVSYLLEFFPLQHRLQVKARFAAPQQGPLELFMPVWTPGSYVVRDYARNLEWLQAHAAGAPLPCRKRRLNRWEVEAAPGQLVEVTYSLYAHELSVRTNFVDADFALVVGAATFLTQPALQAQPHRLEVRLPADYGRCVCALPRAAGVAGDEPIFWAADFDALVDAPLYAGGGDLRTVEVQGCQVEILTEGADPRWDLARASADIATLVATHAAFWGGLPMQRYVFFNLLTGGRGGLEHAHSAVLQAEPDCGCRRSTYLDWLNLVSHEFFHAWNVKRLRPRELVRLDYEAPVPFETLWVAEGFTAYYDSLLVRRAGLCSTAEYLQGLSKAMDRLERTPGQRMQALTEASFDAWIKFYRRDEHSDNSTVSYYLKGSLVAFALDALLRQRGAPCLDVLLRAAYREFAETGYSMDEFCALCGRLAGFDLQPFFTDAVRRAGRLDLDAACAALGLRPSTSGATAADAASAADPPSTLGLRLRQDQGRWKVAERQDPGPAAAAGLAPGDEVLAIDGIRLPAEQPAEAWRACPVGRRMEVLVARRGRLRTLQLVAGAPPAELGGLDGDGPSLRAWLGDPAG